MRLTTITVGLLALLATGCETIKTGINPTVAQLDKLKALAAEGQYQQISEESIDCALAQQGCGQAHWIKADACYYLKEEGPQDIQRQRLDCAVENYDATLMSLASTPDPIVDRSHVELGLLDSLLRRRDLAQDMMDADRLNTLLMTRAKAAQSGPNGRPAGYYYAADAELTTIMLHTTQGGCAEIAQAADLLGEARADGTSFEQPAANLERAIANARSKQGCV